MTEDFKLPAGYSKHNAQAPFVQHIGSIYEKVTPTETCMAMRIEAFQTNIWGFAHATLIASLTEIALSSPAYKPGQAPFLIIHMDLDFLHPVKLGDFVEGRGTVVEQTRSLCFTRARGVVGDKTVFVGSAVLKRVPVSQST